MNMSGKSTATPPMLATTSLATSRAHTREERASMPCRPLCKSKQMRPQHRSGWYTSSSLLEKERAVMPSGPGSCSPHTSEGSASLGCQRVRFNKGLPDRGQRTSRSTRDRMLACELPPVRFQDVTSGAAILWPDLTPTALLHIAGDGPVRLARQTGRWEPSGRRSRPRPSST